ncbi:MAG: PD40 domain-containing protein [Myxococcales bacterium]|nr:MAG: PD40 domain-containing protein [Myxococcales bacterium]
MPSKLWQALASTKIIGYTRLVGFAYPLLIAIAVLGGCNSFGSAVHQSPADSGTPSDSTVDVKNDDSSTTLDCSDGILNGNETDVDCGGSCPACALGKQCDVAADCDSNMCPAGYCTCVYGSFSEPINLGADINSVYPEWDPLPSTDHLRLYFSSDRPDGAGKTDLYVATRSTIGASYSSVVPLSEINGTSSEDNPSVWNADTELAYGTWSTWGVDGTLIHATRSTASGQFTLSTAGIFDAINRSDSAQLEIAVTEDGLLAVFTSNQTGTGDFDLWQTTRQTTSEAFAAPTELTELNSTFLDAFATLSRDGLSVYFNSQRSGGLGMADIYTASRTSRSEAFSAPVAVPGVNSSGIDATPALSADGLTLYFASDRPGGQGDVDLWMSTRSCLSATPN